MKFVLILPLLSINQTQRKKTLKYLNVREVTHVLEDGKDTSAKSTQQSHQSKRSYSSEHSK